MPGSATLRPAVPPQKISLWASCWLGQRLCRTTAARQLCSTRCCQIVHVFRTSVSGVALSHLGQVIWLLCRVKPLQQQVV
jgi:hypothetical protein